MPSTGSIAVMICSRADMTGTYDVDIAADGTASYTLSNTSFTITRRNKFWKMVDGVKPRFFIESESATPPSGKWMDCQTADAQVVVVMPLKQRWDTTLLLQDMWEKRKFTDAVIICGGEHISVHRALLSSASPVFDAALSSTMSEAREAKYEIKESSPGAVKGMLQYIYTGVLRVEAQELADLLELAVQYQINTLIDATATELSDGVAADNVKDRLNVLKRHADHDLVSPALKRVCKTIKESASDDLLLAVS